jgi:phospholipid/cholesterol/gamma-HCH transport system substrate-binding protein
VKRAIETHARDVAAIVVLVVIAIAIGTWILSNQRLTLPAWVPGIGTDFYEVDAEFSTAQAVFGSQGQAIEIAGVPVGDIGEVTYRDGVAHVTLRVKQENAPIYRDATASLRPKTALNDMTIQLDPGTPGAGEVPDGGTLPVAQTQPNVNWDEILAALDGDSRAYLTTLLTAGGEALRDPDAPPALRETLKRLTPAARDTERITRLIARRPKRLRRLVHNLSLLTHELGRRDRQLADLVDGADATFGAIASQDAALEESVALLPSTLDTAQATLTSTGDLAARLGPTAERLRPVARDLEPALRAARPFLRTTTPVVRDDLRPFARDAQRGVGLLADTAEGLRPAVPRLTRSLGVVNRLLNALAYNPAGSEEGYLFWLAWGNHNGASLFSTQDAHGPIRRGIVMTSCESLELLETVASASPQLEVLSALTNAPDPETTCTVEER